MDTKNLPVAVPRAFDDIQQMVSAYYTQKVSDFGPTPLGVDWSCVPTQELRFVQLLKLCNFTKPFSLNDIGCGYGALVAYLDRRHKGTPIDYLGVDLSESMIKEARKLWKSRRLTDFRRGNCGNRVADYSIASGIFNVKLHQSLDNWKGYVQDTLRDMWRFSRLGIAVNFLAPLPLGAKQTEALYREAPVIWSNFFEVEFGAKVIVHEGYGMREYTLLVSRD